MEEFLSLSYVERFKRMGDVNYFRLFMAITVTIMAACLMAIVAWEKPAQSAFPATNGKIIFAGDADDGRDGYIRDLYTISADASTQTNLTSNLVGHQQYPTWSPDGTKIAFVSSHNGGDDEIYVMNA